MDDNAIQQAAALLAQARRSGHLLDALPAACRPANVHEAHAIQAATVATLGERIAGWKVGNPLDGTIIHGALLASRIIEDGGRIAAAKVPLLGVEPEIAFRFDRDLPPRERAYDYEEVAAAVTAFPAIEIVDSRYRDYRNAPLLERVADCVSNGAFVRGAPQPRWREHDLASTVASLIIDGQVIARAAGGHPTVDPLRPAVDLVNVLRAEAGVRSGLVMTTGSFTGMNFAKPGQTVTAAFEGFGSVSVVLEA